MRKILIVFWFTVLSFLSISCYREEPNFGPIGSSDKDWAVSSAVMSLKTIDARRASFSDHLTPEEKCQFVNIRFNNFIRDFKLDEEQIEIIDNLREFLKPEVYKEGSSLNFKAKEFINTWEEKAKNAFSDEQLSYMFSFNTLKEFNELKSMSIENEGLNDCDCATKSDYCSGGKDCKVSLCVIDTYSCGTLFLFHCDGLCEGTTPIVVD